MSDQFTRNLLTFSMTVDFLDNATLRQIETSFSDYLSKAIKSCYFEVAIEAGSVSGAGDSVPVIRTTWCQKEGRRDEQVMLFDPQEPSHIRSQKAYSFLKGKTFWITAREEDRLLRECASIADLKFEGSGGDAPVGIPTYLDYDENCMGESKTAIIVPLMHEGTCRGVLLVELDKVVRYSPAIREHFEELARAVTKLLERHGSSRSSLKDTEKAFEGFIRSINCDECGLPDEKAHVFLSYPGRCDNRVIEGMKHVLGTTFADQVEVTDWTEISETGEITPQIVNAIRESRFGICYLSEESDVEPGRYHDNSNVLFEAGMFHVLRDNQEQTLKGWLPIREDASLTSDLPFNFAASRVLIVPRSADGSLEQNDFEGRLADFISNLLNE